MDLDIAVKFTEVMARKTELRINIWVARMK
jgi:hypothetical protein